MTLTVVVGGQYGGEGKGKIVSYLSVEDKADYVIRCGGPNSGHTVYFKGKRDALRLLPAGVINARTRLLLAAGTLINPSILLEEIQRWDVDPARVRVDFDAGIITEKDAKEEQRLQLRKRIGSTLSGTGAGVAKRAIRDDGFRLARDVPELEPFLTHVSTEVNIALDRNLKVLIEGTQGYGLSLYHSGCYPFTTSRDTTASAFLSEVGVSPVRVDSVIMVIRTFPIRVKGNSGPLKNEITWKQVQRLSGYPYKPKEFTTVTKQIRRVALFDIDLVKKANMVNKPTQIALNGADYLDYRNKGLKDFHALTEKTKRFIQWVEHETGVQVHFVGTGPENEETIDRRKHLEVKIFEQEVTSMPRR
jgi:adenylosuccinate synthase